MKKYGRVVAFALIFIMVFSVFAGLNFYGGTASDEEKVQAASYTKGDNDYLVLEIVPQASMASTSASQYNAPSGKNVVVMSCTPTTLKGADFKYISQADLFVINQNGNTSGSNSFLGSNDITWSVAYEIFKRVAGVSNGSAKFIIDRTVYTGAPKSTVSPNPTFAFGSDGPNGKANAGNYNFSTSKVENSPQGVTNNIAKLYIMLEVMDPATFYGLFFAGDRNSNYVDPKSGDFVTYGQDYNNNTKLSEADRRWGTWFPKMFAPYYALNSNGMSNLYDDLGIDLGQAYSGIDGDLTHYNSSKKRGYSFVGGSNALSGAITSFNGTSFDDITNNGHQYRILVIAPNRSAGKAADLTYDILKAAYADDEGLSGGV